MTSTAPSPDTSPPSGAAGTVVTASPADAGALSEVIADAFWDLAPSRWLIPDPDARRRIFPGYFRLLVDHALDAGLVHTTPDRAAVTLWLPAGTRPPGGYHARLEAATGPWAARFAAFEEALNHRRHPAGTACDHLAILAVRPDRQGQGTGTALLRARHAVLDQAGTAAYLQASDLRTRVLYLAQGYTDHGDPVQLPGGPQMYPMLRPPRPGGHADRATDPSGRGAVTTARQAGQRRGVFEVDQDRALAELELAWADGGYHGFSADGGTWSAISSAGDVLTGDTPDALTQKIRAHWQAMQ